MPAERPPRVVALLAAYNEDDVIADVLEHLWINGVETYFIDDASTDGTVRVVESFRDRGILGIERLPPSQGNVFDWSKILARKEALAASIDADWFIHQDADEFRESPWDGVRLVDALDRVGEAGFNAVSFAVLDFWPTAGAEAGGQRIQDRLTSFEFGGLHNRTQVRCWRKSGGHVDLVTSGGHDARFANRSVFPLRFPMRHYPIRSDDHGRRKVLSERISRFSPEERKLGWHIQYDSLSASSSFVKEPDSLERFDAGRVRMAIAIEDIALMVSEAQQARSEADSVRRDLEHLRSECNHAVQGISQALDRAIRERDDAAAALRGESEARQAEQQAHHVERQNGMQLSARLRDAVADLERQANALADSQLRLAAIEAERDRVGQDLQALLHSRSWRWTSSIRAIASWFGIR